MARRQHAACRPDATEPEELHVYLDTATQQSGPDRHSDPVDALAERWTRDAKKLAATSHLERREEEEEEEEEELDRPPGRHFRVDDDLVVAPQEEWESVPASWAEELTRGRDLTDGLGIDPRARG
jgi:uncharacterized phage protein gp47/JayE